MKPKEFDIPTNVWYLLFKHSRQVPPIEIVNRKEKYLCDEITPSCYKCKHTKILPQIINSKIFICIFLPVRVPLKYESQGLRNDAFFLPGNISFCEQSLS